MWRPTQIPLIFPTALHLLLSPHPKLPIRGWEIGPGTCSRQDTGDPALSLHMTNVACHEVHTASSKQLGWGGAALMSGNDSKRTWWFLCRSRARLMCTLCPVLWAVGGGREAGGTVREKIHRAHGGGAGEKAGVGEIRERKR